MHSFPSKSSIRSLLALLVSVAAVSCSATPEVSSASVAIESDIVQTKPEPSEIESDADKVARNRRVALISKLSDNPSAAEMRAALDEVEAEFGEPDSGNFPVASEAASEATSEPRDPQIDSKIDVSPWSEANPTYAEQNFSESLYTEILEADAYCLATGTCGDVRYLFKDVLLISTVGEFGSTETSVIPHQRISKSQALSYARILDTDSVIDFEGSVVADREGQSQEPAITENYFEADLPAEGAAYELASARMVQIVSDQSGEVFRVSFRVEVF